MDMKEGERGTMGRRATGRRDGDGGNEEKTGRGRWGGGQWGGRGNRWCKHMECLGGMRLQFFLTLLTRATPGTPASDLFKSVN